MKIRCDSCRKVLKKPGGLLFSPPNWRMRVQKFHLCKKCYKPLKKKWWKIRR